MVFEFKDIKSVECGFWDVMACYVWFECRYSSGYYASCFLLPEELSVELLNSKLMLLLTEFKCTPVTTFETEKMRCGFPIWRRNGMEWFWDFLVTI